MTSTAAAALATVWGFPELEPVIALCAGALDLVASAYCAVDPPPDPGLTQQNVLDALNLFQPGIALPAQQLVTQWFLHRYWWDVCYCPNATTPPPPAMSNPGTSIGVGLGAPSGQSAGPCWTVTTAATFDCSQFFGRGFVPPFLPSGPGSLITGFTPATPYVCLPPPGTNQLSWSLECLGSTVPSTFDLVYWSTNGTSASDFVLAQSSITGVQTGSRPIALTAGTPYIDFAIESSPSFDGNWQAQWAGTITLSCTSPGPGALIGPCCPPDPLIETKLDQIYSLVLNLYNRAPAGVGRYQLGTVHSGLAGSGSFPASNLVGVLVDITAAPPTKVQPGNPQYIYDMGWLSCSTPDGFIDEKRLTRTAQIWLPALMPLSNSFGYYLFQGVTATITELIPA